MYKFKEENLQRIKQNVAKETGVSLSSGHTVRTPQRIALAAALVLIIGTASVFASQRLMLRKAVLSGDAPNNTELEETLKINGFTEKGSEPEKVNGFIVSCPFGYEPINIYEGFRDVHEGIDLAAEEGTAVLAAADGKVIETGFSAKNGNYVIMDHGEGYTTAYFHLKTAKASEGDELLAGEELGTVGSTGMATGPHLHFELRLNGAALDPMDYWE